jgi:molecular chaperone HtpG
VTDDENNENDENDEFYEALTNDWVKHHAVKHFRTESGVIFTVLLFVSKRDFYDLFEPKEKFYK